jgi:serine/threonine protein kinase/tetratricopeptide (TPR) repeat protein
MSLLPGTRLGSYEIVELIGAGGMGQVYRARDSRLGRDVAIKVLPEELFEDEERRKRFEREARALASLNHPGIATIHSFEEVPGSSTSSSRHILVMELLRGETLRELLEEGALPARRVVDFAVQIAHALSAAHEKGIVHRDLKPENVFVSEDGRARILDFGLAKLTQPGPIQTSAPTAPPPTETGVVMGTVGYMSPEQVRGQPVDHRSDIFSFGAILYELLSGKRAFRRDTTADTMSAILNEEPPDLLESESSVTPALDRVVKHCLEKNSAERFQSARDIAFALSEASSPGKTARSTGTGRVPGRTARLVAAGVVAVLAASGALLLRRSGKPTSQATGPKRIAVLPFENLGATEDGYFADGMTDEVRSKLAGLSGLTVIASASSAQYRATTKPPEQIAKELGVGYLLFAKVRWQKSGHASRIRVAPELVEVGAGATPTTRWQEPFEADLSDVFKVQGEIAAKVAHSLDIALSGAERGSLATPPTSNLAAYDAYLKGVAAIDRDDDSKAALVQLEKAVALEPGFALAWASISFQHSLIFSQVDPLPAEAEAARKAAERAMELAPESPMSNFALGQYYRLVKNDHPRALEAMSRGLRIAPQDIPLLNRTSQSEAALGRWEDALAHLRRSRQLDPRGFWTDWLLGEFFLRLHRTDETRQAVDRGLELAPTLVYLLRTKTKACLQLGDLAGARAVTTAVPKETDLPAFVAYMSDDDSGTGLGWVLNEEQSDLLLRLTPSAFNDDKGAWGVTLAAAWARRGNEAKVREYAEEARKTFAGQLANAPEHSRRVRLGVALAYLGRKDQAVQEGERALALWPASKDAVSGPEVQAAVVRIHLLCGNPDQALDLLEPLLSAPYYLTAAWLRIDPTFDPLRKNPRFQKLVAEK